MSQFIRSCVFLLLLINLCNCSDLLGDKESKNISCSESWVPYKTDSCIKIIPSHLHNYTAAEELCEARGHLVIIDSVEKQNFVEDYLKSQKLKYNVWIGLKFIEDKKEYNWPYGRPQSFSNWKVGSPKNDSKYCVELEASDSGSPTEFGKWSDKICTEDSGVLCEQFQEWNSKELQAKVMYLTELEAKVKHLMELENKIKHLTELETKVKELENTKVPVGFIYVQLPKAMQPSQIWPMYKWENVSPNYANMFFRVEGNNASSFGTVQEANAPRISRVRSRPNEKHEIGYIAIPIPKNGFSIPILSGAYRDPWEYNNTLMEFEVTDAEIRPANMAMKIWKRMQ